MKAVIFRRYKLGNVGSFEYQVITSGKDLSTLIDIIELIEFEIAPLVVIPDAEFNETHLFKCEQAVLPSNTLADWLQNKVLETKEQNKLLKKMLKLWGKGYSICLVASV